MRELPVEHLSSVGEEVAVTSLPASSLPLDLTESEERLEEKIANKLQIVPPGFVSSFF